MSVKVENTEVKNVVKLTIEVEAAEVEKALQAVYNKQKKNISLPGFRKGKVPRHMVEKMYGPAIFYEDAANDMIAATYYNATKECEKEIVSRPVIDVIQIEKGQPFIYTAEVAVKPEVTLGKYVGVQVTAGETEPTEEEIQAEIDKELNKNARTVTVTDRAIQEGDTAVIDYAGTIDGVAFDGGTAENHSLKIGSGSFIPGFEDQLIGKNAEEEVDVNVTFPEDYHSADLAGKAAVFAVKIHEIKADEVPALDEDFVQDVSEFDTVEEYTADIKAKVAARKEGAVKAAQQQEALEAIVADAEMEIPEAMLETKSEEMINQFAQQLAGQGLQFEQYLQFSGTTLEDLKAQVRPDAEKQIKNDLVVEAIVAAEKIEVSEEEVEEELAKMAEMYGMEVEQIKGYMAGEGEEVLKLDIATRKAMDFVVASAKVVEKVEEAPVEE